MTLDKINDYQYLNVEDTELRELQECVDKEYGNIEDEDPFAYIVKAKILTYCTYLIELNVKNGTYIVIYSYTNECYEMHEVAAHNEAFYKEFKGA